MDTPNPLLGKTLLDIQLADDKEAIRFLTTDGDVIALCDADCCSHTWVESFESTLRRFPAVVVSAEDLDLQRDDEDQDGDVIAFYGFKIVTDQGEVIIDYRNSSNGYYGGNLVWPGDRYFYGGVHGQNISSQAWQAIEGLTA